MNKTKVSTLEKKYLILSLINDDNINNNEFFTKIKSSILEFSKLIEDKKKKDMFIEEQNKLLKKVESIEKNYLKYKNEILTLQDDDKQLDKLINKIVNISKIDVDVLYKFIWIQLYKDKKKS